MARRLLLSIAACGAALSSASCGGGQSGPPSLVAPDGAALRRDLVTVLAALQADPLPRLWAS